MIEAPTRERTFSLVTAKDVRPQPVRWLLPGRIPFGGVSILGGAPGLGKSQLTLAIAADQTRQGLSAIFVGSEDRMEDTIRPRLMACEADLSKFHQFTVEEDGREDFPILPLDVPLLERAIIDTGASTVIIDPVGAHLSPDLNSHSDHSLRQAMAPLSRVAQKTGVAVIAVMHLRKSREGKPLDWLNGGAGFGGIARSVLLFGEKQRPEWHEKDYRYLCHIKCNLAPLAPPLLCQIRGQIVDDEGLTIPTSRVFPIEDTNFDPRNLA